MRRLMQSMLMMTAALAFALAIGCGSEEEEKKETPKDTKEQGEDAVVPGEDAVVPGEDAVIPGEDAVVPGEDAEEPGDDAEVPGEDAEEPGEDAVVPPEDTVEPAGACTNEADWALLDTEEERDAVKGTAQTCGIGCLGDADVAACAAKCVSDDTGLSVECSGCYVGIILCSKDNCLAQCLAAPDSEECFNCQLEAGCFEAFYDCSGMEPAAEE